MEFKHHYANLKEVRLHYVTLGQGAPVVLLHGWPQTWYEWRLVMPLLADQFCLIAPDLRNPPAYIAGYGQNTSPRRTLFHYSLDDYLACGGSLAQKLWSSSGFGPKDMDAAELYDGFSPSTIYWIEAAGFCPRGEAYAFIQDGRIALEGELPVNTFGGSLSEGRLHGMGHIAEAVFQVTGRAEKRQIPGAEVACAIDGSPMLRGSGLVVTKAP